MASTEQGGSRKMVKLNDRAKEYMSRAGFHHIVLNIENITS